MTQLIQMHQEKTLDDPLCKSKMSGMKNHLQNRFLTHFMINIAVIVGL